MNGARWQNKTSDKQCELYVCSTPVHHVSIGQFTNDRANGSTPIRSTQVNDLEWSRSRRNAPQLQPSMALETQRVSLWRTAYKPAANKDGITAQYKRHAARGNQHSLLYACEQALARTNDKFCLVFWGPRCCSRYVGKVRCILPWTGEFKGV